MLESTAQEYNPTNLTPLSLEQQALVVGGYLAIAGAINPETGIAYGISEAGEVDVLGPDAELKEDIGMQAMALMALNNLFRLGMPDEVPEGLTNPVNLNPEDETEKDIYPLAYNAQAVATKWGVDKAIDELSKEGSPLSLGPDGTTLRERVDNFLEKHREAQYYTDEQVEAMLKDLHELVGKRPNRRLFRRSEEYKIPYQCTSETLLHLQELGSSQCVVFSMLGAAMLTKLGLKPHYVASPEHQYLGLEASYYYDGYEDEALILKPYEASHDQQPGLVSTGAHNNYAYLLNDQGRLEEAESHYLENLKLDPEDAEAHNNYANLLADTGRLKEAEVHYLEALRLDPESASTHNNYATLLLLRGELDEANQHFVEAGGRKCTIGEIKKYVRKEISRINARIDELNEGLPEDQRRSHVPMPSFALEQA